MDLFGSEAYSGLKRSAEVSPCGLYRWCLRRSWAQGGDGRTICFVMLNPSTADALTDDPTLRRCMFFARRMGFSTLSVRNLFPFRSPRPSDLLLADMPVGGERGDLELAAAKSADVVVAAWGAYVPMEREPRALQLLAGKPLYCLGVTKKGSPRHPLYVRSDTDLLPFTNQRKGV